MGLTSFIPWTVIAQFALHADALRLTYLGHESSLIIILLRQLS